ncbi:putative Prenylated Rab acceptor 1 [Seiridium cardinale]|uniref:Prenylated Rab acceptor 1 n=1 Tax=Seiridium cardinale TaxID=138064 RepID=A0ABR2XX73_9PEZI
MGRDGRQRRVYAHDEEGESTQEDTEASSEHGSEDDQNSASREVEAALVQSALSRIRRAQEKGKQDVKLSKEELKALERRRKRLEEEAKARQRQASSGSERRRRKEQRIAVPLSQFDAPVSRKTRTGASKSDDALPRHPSPATVNNPQGRAPPMGLFPPPNGSRTRPRSSTSSSHRHSPVQGNSSPFEYNYVHAPSKQRHVSDSSTRSSPSRLPYPPDDGEWRPASSSSRDPRDPRDPFQYMTAGSRASSYASGTAAARRNAPRGTVPAAARNSGSSEVTSDEGDGDTTSDDLGNGAHITRSRTRTPEEAAIVVEEASPSPEPERPKSKRSSSRASPVKRKPVSGNSGGRRRKKN